MCFPSRSGGRSEVPGLGPRFGSERNHRLSRARLAELICPSTTRAVALGNEGTDVTSSRSGDAGMAAVSVEPVTARGSRAGHRYRSRSRRGGAGQPH